MLPPRLFVIRVYVCSILVVPVTIIRCCLRVSRVFPEPFQPRPSFTAYPSSSSFENRVSVVGNESPWTFVDPRLRRNLDCSAFARCTGLPVLPSSTFAPVEPQTILLPPLVHPPADLPRNRGSSWPEPRASRSIITAAEFAARLMRLPLRKIHAQTQRRLGASTSPDHRPGSHFG